MSFQSLLSHQQWPLEGFRFFPGARATSQPGSAALLFKIQTRLAPGTLHRSLGLEQFVFIETETWKVSHSIDNGCKQDLRFKDALQSAGKSAQAA